MKFISSKIIRKWAEIKNDCHAVIGKLSVLLIMLGSLHFMRVKYLLENIGQSINVSGLDVFDATFNKLIITLVVIPLFVFILLNILMLYNKEIFLIHYTSRSKFWKTILSKIILYSFLFVLILVIFDIILGFTQMNQFNSWKTEQGTLYQVVQSISVKNPKINSFGIWHSNFPFYNPFIIITVYSVLTILGLSLVTIFTYIIILLTKNSIVGYVAMLLIITGDTFGNIPIIFQQAIVSYKDFVFFKPLFWDFIYLLSLLFLLNFIGDFIIKKIDFRTSK